LKHWIAASPKREGAVIGLSGNSRRLRMIAAFEIALLFCDKPICLISRSIVVGAKPVKFSSARGFGSPQVADSKLPGYDTQLELDR
jgi:hypothetical protein